MVFNRNLPQIKTPFKISSLRSTEINFVKSYKYNNLTFALLSKIKSHIDFFQHNISSYNHSAKHFLVKIIIFSILDYSDVVWWSASKTLLHKLDVIHHTAIQFVTSASFKTHHCDLYSLMYWPSLHSCRQIHWFMFIYQTLTGKRPGYLSGTCHCSQIEVYILVTSSIFAYQKHGTPWVAPLFSSLLQMTGTIYKRS